MKDSVFLSNIHHAYAQTDGTYAFPNSREGDMLKQAKREIEALHAPLEDASTPSMNEVKLAAAQGAPRSPKRRADWVGQWVRLRSELQNGVTVIPKGMMCRVEHGHRLAELVTEPCKCCGVAIRIRRVDWSHLEFVGVNPTL